MHEGPPVSQKKLSPQETALGDAAMQRTEALDIKTPESSEPNVEAGIARPEENERASVGLRREFDTLRGDESLAPDEKIKGYRRLTDTVDQQRSRLDKIGSEREQLRATREKLGMPEEAAEPESQDMSGEVKDLEALRSEIQDGMLEGKRDGSVLERERGLKEGALKVVSAGEMFRNEVQRRDKNGMDPFFDGRAFAQINNGIQSIRVFAENRSEVSADELATALTTLNSGLEKMGQTRRGVPIREDETSIGRLAAAARDLYESSGKMGGAFREGDENASRAARQVQATSEKIYGLTGRMRSAIRNYQR